MIGLAVLDQPLIIERGILVAAPEGVNLDLANLLQGGRVIDRVKRYPGARDVYPVVWHQSNHPSVRLSPSTKPAFSNWRRMIRSPRP